ncbi:LPS-assembly protein LptD [Motiliproteus coralliicola]|nr:LPS assembly protein LptD [Motiliproteus coralliicola]
MPTQPDLQVRKLLLGLTLFSPATASLAVDASSIEPSTNIVWDCRTIDGHWDCRRKDAASESATQSSSSKQGSNETLNEQKTSSPVNSEAEIESVAAPAAAPAVEAKAQTESPAVIQTEPKPRSQPAAEARVDSVSSSEIELSPKVETPKVSETSASSSSPDTVSIHTRDQQAVANPPLPNTAWACRAVEGSWACRQGSKKSTNKRSNGSTRKVSTEVRTEDNRYRQQYPETYATAASVIETQQQARQQWLDQGRVASRPDGEKLQEQLYADAPYAFLDWYPNPTGVSPLSHCAGSYIEPSFNFEDALLVDDQQPIYVQADNSRTLGNSNTELSGNIYLRKGNRQARAQNARIDHQSETAELTGMVQFREPGVLLLGEQADIDIQNNRAVLQQAQFVFHGRHLRGSAERITRAGDNELIIEQGSYTRCEPGNNSWSINGSEIVLHQQEGLGEVTHATLRFNDVPALYVPYMSFPIDDRRMSGLLFPSFALTSDNGFDYAQPYYFNLAPNYDDTLTLRWINKRGQLLENEFRYLNRYGMNVLSFAYMAEDKERNDEERWILGFEHKGSPASNWSTSVDYTSVSDQDYFDDLGTNLDLNEESHLLQKAQLNYNVRGFSFAAEVRDYQTIDDAADRPYQKLPSLRVKGNPELESDWLQLDYLADFTHFDRDPSGFSGIDRTRGGRLHLETSASIPFERSWGYIKPKVRLTQTQYSLNDQPSGFDSSPVRTIPLLSLDSGLYFDRYFDFAEQQYTQTLEPRLYLLEVPFEDQSELPTFDSSELTFGFNQLFRDNRFSGYDRIGDTRQATLGLTSRLLDNDGRELANASIGQIHYFKDRKVRLDNSSGILTDRTSNLAAEATVNFTRQLRLRADAEWDRDARQNLVRNFKLTYQSDIDHVINLGYRFTRDSVEQTDLSWIWPLNPQWSVLGRWQHDWEAKDAIDTILGFEYENCCWQIRTIYREWITSDSTDRRKDGIFLQFELKGLGGIGTRAVGDSGTKARSFLKEITGFEERSDHDETN